MVYEIEEYVTANDKCPYAKWVNGLKDHIARSKVAGRVERAMYGNFGDWKSLAGAKGVCEMRENYGPGYRIYFSIVRKKIILLLAGSTKKDQDRMIAKAAEYLADYEGRMRE